MENLNAEQVKKALECYTTYNCDKCPIENPDCENFGCIKAALALINSQEQRIGELAEEVEDLKVTLLDRTMALTTLKAVKKELTEDKEKLGYLIDELVKEKRELWEENKKLTEENERLTRLANLRQRDLDNANDLLFKVEDENERLKEFAEYIKTAPIVKIDEEAILRFAIKRYIRNYELHFGKSAQLEKIAKEMLEGEK